MSMRIHRGLLGSLVALLALAFTVGLFAESEAAKRKNDATPEPQEHFLSNGMKLVLFERPYASTVACGWLARVGSADERPGITGMSHLFEHMMFKGTHVIGTKDIKRDLELIEQQEKLRGQMRAEMSKLRAAQRRGEIDDITTPEAKTERYKELEAKFDELLAEQRENMVKNEYDTIFKRNGASFINAFTMHDLTMYFVTVPANKLELWMWMETDRLKNRVFREFYSERDVVYEERRMRVESTPTGKYRESFNSLFWDSSPYSWPVLGWPSDVANITLKQANDFYDLYYAPQNLTTILVGKFDPEEALAMAERYLGSIPRGRDAAPEMITAETTQLAEKRFYGETETNPGVTIRWHTAALTHKDVPALEAVQEILNGPTGRLQRNVILGAEMATNASAGQDMRKYEGMFEIDAEAKEGVTPEQLEQAIHAEIEKLTKGPVSDEELQAAKNRYLADNYRTRQTNFRTLVFYGVADGRGDWRYFDKMVEGFAATTPADIQRVVKQYFTKENRAVAIWTRKEGAEAEDPLLAGLPAQAKGMARQALASIEKADDPNELEQLIAQMDQMAGQVPPDFKPAIDLIRTRALARIEELKQSNGSQAEE